ncbi:hypothetical protein TcasGA2_TC000004 [Tribolium castaneum]|uniref:Uncharacterized protein n=1 Tax=Tribolium castaneum TaxID=7070 RepID=D7EL31_TRICA|nr:hypothetical protein TcasGA2_TC000004 [Tribolium castaneum]
MNAYLLYDGSLEEASRCILVQMGSSELPHFKWWRACDLEEVGVEFLVFKSASGSSFRFVVFLRRNKPAGEDFSIRRQKLYGDGVLVVWRSTENGVRRGNAGSISRLRGWCAGNIAQHGKLGTGKVSWFGGSP